MDDDVDSRASIHDKYYDNMALEDVKHVDDLVDNMVDDWATDINDDQCLLNYKKEVTEVVCSKEVASKIDVDVVPIQIPDTSASHEVDIHVQGEKQCSVPAIQALVMQLDIQNGSDNREKCVRRRR